MVPAELIPFLESGLATLVGSCSKAGRPACVHGIGVKLREGGAVARVYLPQISGQRVLAQLREHPQIAVTLSRPETHRTVQLKGPVLAIVDADVSERGVIEELFLGYARDLVFIGLPRAKVLRFERWPCAAVDFEPKDVFIQTPGPLAGARVSAKEPT